MKKKIFKILSKPYICLSIKKKFYQNNYGSFIVEPYELFLCCLVIEDKMKKILIFSEDKYIRLLNKENAKKSYEITSILPASEDRVNKTIIRLERVHNIRIKYLDS